MRPRYEQIGVGYARTRREDPRLRAVAMAILTVHHWDAEQEAGVRELRRVARGPVVMVTYDPRISRGMWLMRDYLPEVADLDDPLPDSPDTVDWTLGSLCLVVAGVAG